MIYKLMVIKMVMLRPKAMINRKLEWVLIYIGRGNGIRWNLINSK